MSDTAGPFIVWENHGYEGWLPTSYQTLKEALLGHKYASECVITKTIDYVVEELPLAGYPW